GVKKRRPERASSFGVRARPPGGLPQRACIQRQPETGRVSCAPPWAVSGSRRGLFARLTPSPWLPFVTLAASHARCQRTVARSWVPPPAEEVVDVQEGLEARERGRTVRLEADLDGGD